MNLSIVDSDGRSVMRKRKPLCSIRAGSGFFHDFDVGAMTDNAADHIQNGFDRVENKMYFDRTQIISCKLKILQ